MKKTIFAVSDIHGHCTLLKEALDKAGFDMENPDHLLVVCGDCFDRGRENKAVYEYLTGVKNKVLVRGNHEDMMLDLLDCHKLHHWDVHNGTDYTVEEFLGAHSIDFDANLKKNTAGEKTLRDFIGSMVDYFETKNYVFIHGWVPVNGEGKIDGWRNATPEMWEDARFLEWMLTYRAGLTLPRKTIVCGHRSCSYGCMFDMKRSKLDASPFRGDGMIAIDALTVRSGDVNVIVIEDEELLPSVTHRMSLKDEFFEAVKSGKKTVELRVYDSKRRDVKLGDTVLFSKYSDPDDTVKVRVTGTHLYDSFEELVKDFKPSAMGFTGKSKSAIAAKMNRIYAAKIAGCKPFAIKIKLEE